jgi:hypothetical protein
MEITEAAANESEAVILGKRLRLVKCWYSQTKIIL